MRITIAEAGTDVRTVQIESGSTVADLIASHSLWDVIISRRSNTLSLEDVLEDGRVVRLKRKNIDGTIRVDAKPAGANEDEAPQEEEAPQEDEEDSYTEVTLSVVNTTIVGSYKEIIEDWTTVLQLLLDLWHPISWAMVTINWNKAKMSSMLHSADDIVVSY